MKASFRFIYPVRIYIEDTDAGGIVYHGQYLKFMERARTEYLRQLGVAGAAVSEDNVVVIHSLDLAYYAPAFLDDIVKVGVLPMSLKRASFTFMHNIYRNEELLVKAHVKFACVNKNDYRPVKVPALMYESLKADMTALKPGVENSE